MIRTDFIPNVNLADYYGGTITETPALSQSVGGKLLRSAKHGWAAHPRLGGKVSEPSDEMELGNILDELVLGGSRRIAELPFEEFRTKEARAARDDAKAAGYIPVKSARLAELRKVADSAVKSMALSGVRLDGMPQACLLWSETASNGAAVQCCALLDMLWVEDALVRDLKTGADCSPKSLPAKCIRLGYDIQAAAYISAVEHVFPALAGRVRFENVWLETSFPNVTLVSEPDGEMLHLGRIKWQRAVDAWEQSVRLDKWPGYQTPGNVLRLSPPPWALEELMEEEHE